MSYEHPILVPGAPGHDDPVALRTALEEYAQLYRDKTDAAETFLTAMQAFAVSTLETPGIDSDDLESDIDDFALYVNSRYP
jgi:hypothetical protein